MLSFVAYRFTKSPDENSLFEIESLIMGKGCICAVLLLKVNTPLLKHDNKSSFSEKSVIEVTFSPYVVG